MENDFKSLQISLGQSSCGGLALLTVLASELVHYLRFPSVVDFCNAPAQSVGLFPGLNSTGMSLPDPAPSASNLSHRFEP